MSDKSVSWAFFVTYLIYIIAFEFLVIGGCAYVVFVLGHSGLWWFLAILVSGSAYKPEAWRKLGT